MSGSRPPSGRPLPASRCLRARALAAVALLLALAGCGGTTTALAVPRITAQPTSVAASAGGSASFSVVATGSDLTYQWYKDGIAIDDATSATYTISPVTTGSTGSYAVVVGNTNGHATSTSATLTVSSGSIAAPTITSQPASVAAAEGNVVVFAVTATGSGLTYQWYRDGVAIAGAKGSTCVIASASEGNAGAYCVVVSNTAGSITSSTATLEVSSTTAAASCPAESSLA